MIIPSHTPPSCIGSHSHNYPIDTLTQGFVTIEGTPIVVSDPLNFMDKFIGDRTWINTQGGNSFVTIS